MLRLQHFYNKSQVVSCYWFKFENNTKISFLRDATSTTILQHFYNKSWMVSYYWFKFEFSSEITFLTQQ